MVNQQPPQMQQNPYVASAHMSSNFRSPKERKATQGKLLMRHLEIMTPDERSTMKQYTSMILASGLFLVMVQIPLSIKYFLLVRKDATLHGHLLKRVYMFPMFSFPMFYLGSTLAEKHL